MKTKHCKSCDIGVIMLRNPKTDKIVPVDIDTLTETDIINIANNAMVFYRPKGSENPHTSHFLTCNDPNRFSKNKNTN